MCAIFTGNHLIKLKEVDSTNTYLSNLASKEKLPDGTVVSAAYQFAGKGQRGNRWLVDKNMNLTFSILYYPTLMSIDMQVLLSQAVSLGVYDYLIPKCKQVRIKWPNDLYVANKKIGGLLIENTIKGDSISQVIIGVGLNINQEIFDLSLKTATSLRLENDETYDLDVELLNLLTFIERRYLQWKNTQILSIKDQYLKVLYLFGSWHNYQLPDGTYLSGKIIGIDDNGLLIVEDIEARRHKFANKEIIF
jgi:BirA family transcriptional regulator, biotin operon repressor / biotin---[acetyl-CoA-carboxylase] ligase